MERFISLVGLFTMVFIAFILSDEKKKKINWRTVISGILLQIVFGLLILKTDAGMSVFEGARQLFAGILNFTNEGSKFVFGNLTNVPKMGFIFAFYGFADNYFYVFLDECSLPRGSNANCN